MCCLITQEQKETINLLVYFLFPFVLVSVCLFLRSLSPPRRGSRSRCTGPAGCRRPFSCFRLFVSLFCSGFCVFACLLACLFVCLFVCCCCCCCCLFILLCFGLSCLFVCFLFVCLLVCLFVRFH